MVKEVTTEQNILAAAREVFHSKGMAGARMQEIADKAGINKALLHYYFRSKEKLCEAVFTDAVQKLIPTIKDLWMADLPLFEKTERFIHGYIDLLIANPYMPSFVIHEISQNPAWINQFVSNNIQPEMPMKFIMQVQHEIAQGRINSIHPLQFILNLLSLCIFPFVMKPVIHGAMNVSEADFNAIMHERKREVTDFVINAISKR